MARFPTAAIAAAFAAVTLTAPAASAQSTQSTPNEPITPRVSSGTFVHPYTEDAAAITYAPDEVPEGASATLVSLPLPGDHHKVIVVLRGLEPNRAYGAHVHTQPCGPTGEDAGPHFQQVEAPEGVSGNPKYANPDNEVWLDFRTDSEGNAVTKAYGDWDLRAGKANSFVIHEHHTRTAHGAAGDAGSRLACLNADF